MTDEGDAPELTPELAARAQISVGGEVVREATGTVTMTDAKRAKLADWLNAFKADPFSTGADKVDRLLEVLAALEQSDAVMGEAVLFRLLQRVTDAAENLAGELHDPGTEALSAIYCARTALAHGPIAPVQDDDAELIERLRRGYTKRRETEDGYPYDESVPPTKAELEAADRLEAIASRLSRQAGGSNE